MATLSAGQSAQRSGRRRHGICLNLRHWPILLLGGGEMKALPQSVPSRVIVEGVEPEIDGGQFPSKRTVGEEVIVGADVYADGHEMLAAVLRYRGAQA